VVRDAMMEPVRKVQSATHFKKVCVLLCLYYLLFNRLDVRDRNADYLIDHNVGQ